MVEIDIQRRCTSCSSLAHLVVRPQLVRPLVRRHRLPQQPLRLVQRPQGGQQLRLVGLQGQGALAAGDGLEKVRRMGHDKGRHRAAKSTTEIPGLRSSRQANQSTHELPVTLDIPSILARCPCMKVTYEPCLPYLLQLPQRLLAVRPLVQ